MALTPEEKTALRRSEIMKEIKDEPALGPSMHFIPISSLFSGIGRLVIAEDEIKEMARMIENVMDDTVSVEILWASASFKISRA